MKTLSLSILSCPALLLFVEATQGWLWSVQVCALEIPGVDIAVACECRLVSCYENEKCQLLIIANQLEIKLNLSQA